MTKLRERGQPKKQVSPSLVNASVGMGTYHQQEEIIMENDIEEGYEDEMEENEGKLTELETLNPPEENTDSRKLWIEVFSGNHNPWNGMSIEFVTPKIVDRDIKIEIEEADIEKEKKV
ncbi:unnamed protein product [Lathyrus oleraceus]